MKKVNIPILLFLFCSVASFLHAQNTRYVDPIFSGVTKVSDVVYGTNISVLTGTPAPLDLKMDVYAPAGDTETERPVVLYLHTGIFLPQYLNGQITGGKLDSTVVEVCTRLAKRGYVAIAATYRQGWLPTSPDQNVRTGSLLQAAYRGIQDARTCVRFLRKNVAEGGNTYGIDPDKIVMWGQGTGGYISLGAAFLDDYQEIVIDKFINTATALPFVVESVHGDIYGTNTTPLNSPNHLGYSSDFAMAINMGGALADSSWVDGADNEPVTMGYHVVTDPFAPFGNGPVIVPTTQEFVVAVSGTRTAVQFANEAGTNDILAPVLTMNPDALTQFVTAVKNVPVNLAALGQGPTTLGADHIYPFRVVGLGSGPWDWWNKPLLDVIISQYPAQFMLNSETLHMNGLITNPDMSATKARLYIDTIMQYFIPRACQGLQLESCLLVSKTEEVANEDLVQLSVAPNPSSSDMLIQCNAQTPMMDLQVFNMNGMLVRSVRGVNTNQYTLQRDNLPPGMYLVKVRFEQGFLAKRVVFN